jgi:hypothetical protein
MRNPLKIPKSKRIKRRPYTKELSFLYRYRIFDSGPTKKEIELRRNRYTGEKSDKIIRNPFQKTGFLGLKRKGM